MKGTLVHDGIMIVSMILIVFLVLYWSVNHGVELVEDLMSSSPLFVQQHLSGGLSIACMHDGEYSSKYYIYPTVMIIELTEWDVTASVEGKQYPTEIERGGYIKYGNAAPIPFVKCPELTYQTRDSGEIVFNPKVGDKYVEVAKKGNLIGVGVGG